MEQADAGSFPQIAWIRTGCAARNVLSIRLLNELRNTYLVCLELVPRLLVSSPSPRQEFKSLRVTEQLSEPR